MTASTAFSDGTARAGVNIHQFYSLDLRGSSAAALADVYAFDGTRGIGEPTRYTIQFTHPRHDMLRAEFLNRMGAFVIQPPPRDRWSEPESPRRVQGVVTGFALKDTNRDQSLYEIVLESRLALLRNAPKCRFFLDMSIPEIIVAYDLPVGFCDAHEKPAFWTRLTKLADWTQGYDAYFHTGVPETVEKPISIDWGTVGETLNTIAIEDFKNQSRGLPAKKREDVVYGD